ncbi:hypothetical protein C1H46_007031 [Malus baccata]|uniref:Uncharacterized protein n=1 Tax=Malus baccata TaxID=106549 RepID=A0A540N8J7_MALBA|nr:hypothetical protein C1H46_032884 [Malus baccata]TQE07378.1 hypothetical protein C1H46_007031 [Malus baccata]
MELEVVAGKHGGGGQCLQSALGDSEFVVLKKIQAAVDERRHLRRTQALSGHFQKLMQALHSRNALVGVLGTRELQRFLHRSNFRVL